MRVAQVVSLCEVVSASPRGSFEDNLDNVLISHSFERLFPLESYAERSFEPLGEIRISLERQGIFSLGAAGS